MFLKLTMTYFNICHIFTRIVRLSTTGKVTVSLVVLVSCVHFIVLWKYLSCGRSECSTCGPVGLSDVDLPPTALASFPGSGNTWIRSLIQDATGILTGSEYFDHELFHNGFLGEGINTLTHGNGSKVLMVKTHDSGPSTRNRYKRAILLVRDPKDSIMAEFHRVYGGGHRRLGLKSQFVKHWSEFVDIHLKGWTTYYSDWMTFDGSVHIILYSDVMSRPFETLKRIFSFLQINVTEAKMRCALCRAGRYKRPDSVKHAQTWTQYGLETTHKMYAVAMKDYFNITGWNIK